jgi:hypothetical protein
VVVVVVVERSERRQVDPYGPINFSSDHHRQFVHSLVESRSYISGTRVGIGLKKVSFTFPGKLTL